MPRKDGDFLLWAMNFSTYVADHGAELGLSPAQIQEITAGVGMLDTKLGGHINARQAARAAQEAKHRARSSAEETIRAAVRLIQAQPDTSDAQRESMGITVAGKGTAAINSHLPTYPIATINTAQRLRHRITYFDASNISRKARPAHTFGCEIWCAITSPGAARPLDEEKYRNMALSTASPCMIEFDGNDAAQTAHYRLRWLLNGGKKGSWGPIVSATIVG